MSDAPELTAFRIHKYTSMPIVPAPGARKWMDETNQRFAYRCLPLLIANQSGWFLLNTHKIRAVWNGGKQMRDLTAICKAGPKDAPCPAMSHFGDGVLTFNLNYLFRTPPGWNLLARGPANMPKDGAAALEGVIETDWAVATFTMNWKMTTPNLPVDFEIGEPICMIVPVRRGEVESFAPTTRELSSEPQLAQEFKLWADSRLNFNKQLVQPGSEAAEEKWQRDYMHGATPSGVTAPQHQVKLAVREFKKRD